MAQSNEELQKKREQLILGKFQHPLINVEHFKYTVNGKPSLISEESIRKIKSTFPEVNGVKFRRTHARDQKTDRTVAAGKEPFTDFEKELSLPFSVVADSKGTLFALYEGKDVLGQSKVLGKGSFGQVKFAQNLETGEVCIVKVQEKKVQTPWEDWVREKKEEGDLAQQAGIQQGSLNREAGNKRYDIQVYGGDNLMFQTSPDPEKQNDIFKNRTVPWSKEKDYIADIGQRIDIGIKVFQQMQIMHKQGILHRDIKPENILYDRTTGEVTIIDYGLAAKMNGEGKAKGNVVGSPFAMAPEIYEKKEYSAETDTFAASTVLNVLFGFDMDNKGWDFKNKRYAYLDPIVDEQARDALLSELYEGPKRIEEKMMQEALMLVKSMLKKDPNERQMEGRKLNSPVLLEQEMRRIKNNRDFEYKKLADEKIELLKKYDLDLSPENLSKILQGEKTRAEVIRDFQKQIRDFNAKLEIKLAIKELGQIPKNICNSVIDNNRKELRLYQQDRKERAGKRKQNELKQEIEGFKQKIKDERNAKIESHKEQFFSARVPDTIKHKKVMPKNAINLYHFLMKEELKYKKEGKESEHYVKIVEEEKKRLTEDFPLLKEIFDLPKPPQPSLDETKNLLKIAGELFLKNKEYIKKYDSGKKVKTKRTGKLIFADTDAKYNNAVALDKELDDLLKDPATLNENKLSQLLEKYEEKEKKTLGKLSSTFSSGEVETILKEARKSLKNTHPNIPEPK